MQRKEQIREEDLVKVIDLRSDTKTLPTEEMRRAVYEAEVGDDVSREDLTVNRLEELAAHMLGKESALFTPSGIMSNLLAVLTHTRPSEEILLGSGHWRLLNNFFLSKCGVAGSSRRPGIWSNDRLFL